MKLELRGMKEGKMGMNREKTESWLGELERSKTLLVEDCH